MEEEDRVGRTMRVASPRGPRALGDAALTVWPESYVISKPSEHQRVSRAWTATVPVCARLD
jgi:hypothetical protein